MPYDTQYTLHQVQIFFSIDIDISVHMHDRHCFNQLQHLECLIINTFNNFNITKIGFMVIHFTYFRILMSNILITPLKAT
jgi:hypothetical protein